MQNRKKLIEELLESVHTIKHNFVLDSHSFSDNAQVTYSQWIVLRVVRQYGGIGIKEIASKLGITSSAATQLVDGLAKRGYLKREESPEDRRALKISLSDKGQEKISGMKTRSLERLSSIFDVFDDVELAKYCELNKKIVNKMLGR